MSTSKKSIRGLPNLALQEERLTRGWTQQELANRVGTTVVNVSRWERGITSPNPYFRQKLCAIFEKDATELGLFVARQIPQNETSQAHEEVTPHVSEKEHVPAPHDIASLSLQKRLLSERRTVVTTISVALVSLVSGSVLLSRSFLFSQSVHSTQNKSSIEVTSTPILTGKVIAEDTFQRANQTFWGIASDGLQWREDASTLKNFSIVNHTAQITTSTGDNYNAIIGPKISNGEVLFTSSISYFTDTNLGAVLRWQDTNHWYKAYITDRELILQKKVDTVTRNQLRSIPFATKPGLLYTIRFRVVGTLLMAKVWLKTNKEPDSWMITASDDSYTEGFCGLRIRALYGAIARVTSFTAWQFS